MGSTLWRSGGIRQVDHMTRSCHSPERRPSMPSGSKRLTRPFILCRSSLSSCILKGKDLTFRVKHKALHCRHRWTKAVHWLRTYCFNSSLKSSRLLFFFSFSVIFFPACKRAHTHNLLSTSEKLFIKLPKQNNCKARVMNNTASVYHKIMPVLSDKAFTLHRVLLYNIHMPWSSSSYAIPLLPHKRYEDLLTVNMLWWPQQAHLHNCFCPPHIVSIRTSQDKLLLQVLNRMVAMVKSSSISHCEAAYRKDSIPSRLL